MERQWRTSLRTVESLGKVIYETKPKLENVVAGIIIAALLIGGGIGTTSFIMRQLYDPAGDRAPEFSDWIAAHALALVGILVATGGAYMLVRMRSLSAFRLRVCSEGFCVVAGGEETAYAWDEIVEVKEFISHERLPLVKGPAKNLMPTKMSRSYTVVRCDGTQFDFDSNLLPSTSLLAGPLATAARTRGFDWSTSEETT
jgi:hypothetical protein